MKIQIELELKEAVARVLYDIVRLCDAAARTEDGYKITVSNYDFASLRSVLSDLTTRRRNG